jgi:hypothetical protein
MIIFEPQCIGLVHSKVNAAYILLCGDAFPNEEIVFYGETEHISIIRNQLTYYSINIQYVAIDIPRGGQSYINRFILEVKNVFRIITNPKSTRSNILLLSITSATLLAVKFFELFSQRRVFIVIHGILDKVNRKPANLFERLFWFKLYLIYCNRKRIKYIFLGQFIESNILALFPKLEPFSSALDLPYDLTKPVDENSRNSSNILFGCAGVAAISKGSHLFFELAKDISVMPESSNTKFIYIGQFVDIEMNRYVNEFVDLPSKDEPLDSLSYQAHFLGVDFLVLFYPKDSYRLTFSGVFMDAVKFETPIIAIRNDFFDYYFAKYGEMGWLCSDYHEILKLVHKLACGSIQIDLRRYAASFKKIKADYDGRKQSSKLRKLLE